LGLCGDAVDNIPGVPGIGAKTAAAILQNINSIDEIYADINALAHLDVRGAKKLPAKFQEYEEQARLPMDKQKMAQVSDEMGGRAMGLFERIHKSIN